MNPNQKLSTTNHPTAFCQRGAFQCKLVPHRQIDSVSWVASPDVPLTGAQSTTNTVLGQPRRLSEVVERVSSNKYLAAIGTKSRAEWRKSDFQSHHCHVGRLLFSPWLHHHEEGQKCASSTIIKTCHATFDSGFPEAQQSAAPRRVNTNARLWKRRRRTGERRRDAFWTGGDSFIMGNLHIY